ncbi:MAG: 3-hydroxyacyl-ACP dehydratase FabZ [Parachlamydiales bacterium]|jgi:3-hydroxyacyl-[acyl-carrier-protein] dehydratase
MPASLLTIAEIKKILPHRYPFLMVDKVVKIDLEKNLIVAQKNVTANEEFFLGHFPESPIMPGVLILEALAQTGGILVHQKTKTTKIALLLNVSEARFRRPVLPGDVLVLQVEALHISNNGGKILAKALVEDQVAVEAELSFALIDRQKLK